MAIVKIAEKYRSINSQSSDYTLVLSDGKCIIEMTGSSPQTLTIPHNSSVDFPIMTVIPVTQSGTGEVTIAADSGVTLQSQDDAYKLAGQYAMCVLVKMGTNTWRIEGNLTS